MVIGERVALVFGRDADENVGTISALEPERVRVTWPKAGERTHRMRVWYSSETAAKMLRRYPQ